MSKIAIVIPVFKPEEKYLRALFASIETQTEQGFTIVISDDNEDERMIQQLLPSSLASKTTYLQNRSARGIFGNLNNAILHTSAEFIQVFCQDDVMLPDLLKVNSQALIQHPDIDIAFSKFDDISEEGTIATVERPEFEFIPSYLKATEANNFFLYFGCIPGNLSPVMIRRTLFDKMGYFNEQMRFAGDFDFWIRASAYTGFIWTKQAHLLVRNHAQRAGLTLGTIQRFSELKQITSYLLEHNTLPLAPAMMRRYIHIHLLRSLLGYALRYSLYLRPQFWKSMKHIFDNKPFSIWLAWLSFLKPIPKECIPLKNMMEIKRS